MRKTKKRTKITSFREIITFALLAALLTLSGCGEKTVVNPDGTETTQTEKGIKVTETAAKAAQTEAYSCADFDITIPKGWRVESGGANMLHSIRVYDPEEPLNQMFVLLKADCLLHSQEGRHGSATIRWETNRRSCLRQHRC